MYAIHSTQDLLASSVAELRDQCLPSSQPDATVGDLAAYLALVAISLALMALPILALLYLYLNRG